MLNKERRFFYVIKEGPLYVCNRHTGDAGSPWLTHDQKFASRFANRPTITFDGQRLVRVLIRGRRCIGCGK